MLLLDFTEQNYWHNRWTTRAKRFFVLSKRHIYNSYI